MEGAKLLLVDHDEKTRQAVDEVLAVIRCKYHVAGSPLEARDLLAANEYLCILLGCEIAVRPGGIPRRQNSEHFMDDGPRPPVIVIYHRMADMDEDDLVCWVADMTHRGVERFVRRPFSSGGRTLDRAIKKVVAARRRMVEPGRARATPAPADSAASQEAVAAPTTATASSGPAPLARDSAPSGALTEVQLNILEAMAKSPHKTMFQADIIEAGGYGKHATRQCLQRLKQLGLVHHPQGNRKGLAVTDAGRAFLNRASSQAA
jgi:hypothetical protein